MQNKTDRYLGLARRAGHLVTGMGTCAGYARKGRIKMLIMTTDLSRGSRAKAEQMAKREHIPYRIYSDSDHLSHLTGTSGRMLFGITDVHFAEMILKAMDTDETYEKEVFE